MEEGNTKKELPLIAWLGVLAGLVLGVILIFAMLEIAIPKPEGLVQTQEVSGVEAEENTQPAPKFCPDCGQGLPESFDWGQYCPYCGEQAMWK